MSLWIFLFGKRILWRDSASARCEKVDQECSNDLFKPKQLTLDTSFIRIDSSKEESFGRWR